MKKLLIICMMAFSFGEYSFAQDSTRTSKFDTELTIASRNVSRGVSWGNSPSIQMMGNYKPCNYFEAGTYGQVTLNGIGEGYGNQLNLYATFKYKRVSLTVDDYFYFNENDNDNDYFEYGSDKTQHFIETRAKYDGERFDVIAAYTVYQNSNLSTGDAVYMEANYELNKDFALFAGYVTDASDQMAYTDAGMTSVGTTWTKKFKIKDYSPTLKTSLVFCPNHENVAEMAGVGGNPVYLVAAITF